MRIALPLFAAFAVGTGCAHRSAPALDPIGVAQAESGGDWARLSEPPTDGVVRFTLSRPGYVAVFAVIPGESVRLVYPISGAQGARPLPAGSYSRSSRRGVLAEPRLVRLGGGYSPRPRFLYLVASDRPLDLTEPRRWPGGSIVDVRAVGDLRVNPRSPDVEDTFETLFDLVVTDPLAAQVATDVFEYYPDVRFRRGGRVASLTAFRCANGSLVYVPGSYGNGAYGGYDAGSWYGVDFIGNRYVGADCFAGYAASGPGAPGVPGGVTPDAPAGAAARFSPDARRPRDVNPSVPLDPERVRPAGGGAGAGPGTWTVSGFGRIERTERRPAPQPAARPEPRPMAPEPRMEAPEPRPAPRAEPRSEPQATPRMEPAPRPEPRAEPRMEPRMEPRLEPRSTSPAHSEPATAREPLQPAQRR